MIKTHLHNSESDLVEKKIQMSKDLGINNMKGSTEAQGAELTIKTSNTKLEVAEVAFVAEVVQQKPAIPKLASFKCLAEKGKTLEPLKKVFGNYILEKSTTLFPSERGVGKSMLAMQLAIKIANGDKQFLGEDLEMHGNVLYINLELGEHTLCKRFEKMYDAIDENDEFQPFCLTERRGLVEIMPDVRKICEEKKPVLIVIDNLRTAFNGADNEKNKEMTSAITELNKFKDDVGSSILLVHHTKKGTGNQLTNSDMQSGAGSLSDLVDSDFFLRKSGVSKDLRILKRIKSREAEEQDGAKLISLNPDNLWFDFVEEGVDEAEHVIYEKSTQKQEEAKQKCFDYAKSGMSNAEIARKTGFNRSTIGRWLAN